MNIFDIMKNIVSVRGKMKITAHGNSMFPNIKDGDEVTVINDINNLKKGDIILYYNYNRNDEVFIIHRIVENINNKILLTKGDNNEFSDKPIRNTYIIGKVVLENKILGGYDSK